MVDEADLAELGGLAAALTGSAAGAARLLGETSVLPRARRVRDETALRDLLVHRHLRSPSPAPPADTDDLAAELRPVVERLSALGPADRAAVVLVRLTGLTLTEVAGLLDTSPTALRRRLDAAEATLAADPFTLRAALEALSWRTPTPEMVAAARFRAESGARRRRGRRRALALVLTLVAVAAVAVPAVRTLQPLPSRSAGAWVFGLAMEPAPGWTVDLHAVTVDQEFLTTSSPDAGQCQLQAALPSAPPDNRVRVPDDQERVWVNGKPATYSDEYTAGAGVRWPYGDGGEALLVCTDRGDRRAVLDLAERVRFAEASPMVLPVALGAVPDGFEVGGAGYDGDSPILLLFSGSTLFDAEDRIFLTMSSGTANLTGRAVTIDGLTVKVVTLDQEVRACRTVGSQTICAEANRGEPTVRATEQATERVVEVVRTLRVAPDLADRATWFDARDALRT